MKVIAEELVKVGAKKSDRHRIDGKQVTVWSGVEIAPDLGERV